MKSDDEVQVKKEPSSDSQTDNNTNKTSRAREVSVKSIGDGFVVIKAPPSFLGTMPQVIGILKLANAPLQKLPVQGKKSNWTKLSRLRKREHCHHLLFHQLRMLPQTPALQAMEWT